MGDGPLIDLVLEKVAAEGLVDKFLQVVFVDDAARFAIGVEDREEGLPGIAAEKLEDRVDAFLLVDGRQMLDLLADEDLVERLAGAAAGDLGERREEGGRVAEEGRRGGEEISE